MVIVKKDYETKEIEIQGFRNILKDQKHPDYKELKMYMKKGWIPVDTEDDAKQIEKAQKRKKNARESQARKPSYEKMESKIKELIKEKKLSNETLDKFYADKKRKYNYNNVLNWYKETIKNIPSETETEIKKDETETKNDKGQIKNNK